VLYGKNAGSRYSRSIRSVEQMTSYGSPSGRVPGTRRERVRGYLRAANELRQAYQAQLQQRLQASENDWSMPGSYPDVDVVRTGDEELLLFPSYAHFHIKRRPEETNAALRHEPGLDESIEAPRQNGDADYWRREWEKYEDANAVVDVDVRGWIYSPQKGPLNRKNRLLVAVTRRLSGIPAPPPSPITSRTSSPHPSQRRRSEDSPSRYEEEAAAREAEHIARHGQREAEAASQGNYSAMAGHSYDTDSPWDSHSSSPARGDTASEHIHHPVTESEDDPGQPLQSRPSWNQQANMSREELVAANELLITRLKPFMTAPAANTPITVFFFNDTKSQSKSVTTNESGHFNLRAALDFVPTQVRVLASDKLSATEDVVVTDRRGISLVSDIDDTIKHSAIASGAREIFKNTFIRNLGDLIIPGVKEWYTKLAKMGVKMHYVSNSPWQLYPLLRSYFALVGLPSGSIHLKQYSGMLQGIFEPAAERKRGSLERIMNDFPERKFILVGDSGEADLEVYTDVVLEHPGRILGVFIRDVTTPPKKSFFDQGISHSPPDAERGRARPQSDAPEDRPALPARPTSIPAANDRVNRHERDLIDLSDEPESKAEGTEKSTPTNDLRNPDQSGHSTGSAHAPGRPPKPSSLRNFTTHATSPTDHENIPRSNEVHQERTKKKPPPPPPPKPRRPTGAVDGGRPDGPLSLAPPPPQPPRPPLSSPRPSPVSPNLPKHEMTEPARSIQAREMTRTNTSSSFAYSYPDRAEEGYVASARRQISSVYNALPALKSSSPSREAGDRSAPPTPPRRGLTSYPAAAARWATGMGGDDLAFGGDDGAPGAPYNKKEEIWKRRWARAEDIMKRRGVMLKSWRVGSDVMDDCVRLVERASKDIERAEKDNSRE